VWHGLSRPCPVWKWRHTRANGFREPVQAISD
jgi:hypothetical protein